MSERQLLLHGLEDGGLIQMCPSISTITFYKGIPPLGYLKEKVAEILQHNPWLSCDTISCSGKANGDGDGIAGVEMVFDAQSIHIDEYFKITKDSSINMNMSVDDISIATIKYQVKNGTDTLNKKNEPHFLVTVIIIDESHFGLIVSLSHVIGDGATFYKLYAMLDRNTDVRKLDAVRNHYYIKLATAKLNGDNDTYEYFFDPIVFFNFMKTLIFRPTPKVAIHRISNDWIRMQKNIFIENENKKTTTNNDNDNVNQSVKFVSTNDILTSWYFNFVRCDVGCMAMNLRDRLEGITADMAGNYEVLVGYQPQDYVTPDLIRKSIALQRRCGSEKLPTRFETLFTKSKLSILSSWVTFYKDVQLEQCSQQIHLPCVENKNMVSDNLGVIFRPNANELALLTFTRPGISERLTEIRNIGDDDAGICPFNGLLLPQKSTSSTGSMIPFIGSVILLSGIGLGVALTTSWYLSTGTINKA